MKIALSIALGGSIGALSRYYLSKGLTTLFGTLFPAGTLTVNLAGALLIGFFYGVFDRTIIREDIRAIITIGFLGAFTTFSTFALENVNLLRDGEIRLAVINILISNTFGLLLAFAGIMIAGMIFQK